MPCSEERRQLFGSNVGRPWRLPRDQWPDVPTARGLLRDAAAQGVSDGPFAGHWRRCYLDHPACLAAMVLSLLDQDEP